MENQNNLNNNSSTTEPFSEKKLPQGLKILLALMAGVMVLIVLSISLFGIFGKKIMEKSGEKFLETAIENEMKQKNSHDEANIDVDISEKGLTVQDPNTGEKIDISVGKEVPEGVRKHVPLMPNKEVLSQFSIGPNITVIMNTTDSVPQVTSFYDAEAPKMGWKIESTMDLPGGTAMRSYQKENFVFNLFVGKEENSSKTNMTISLQEVKESN